MKSVGDWVFPAISVMSKLINESASSFNKYVYFSNIRYRKISMSIQQTQCNRIMCQVFEYINWCVQSNLIVLYKMHKGI